MITYIDMHLDVMSDVLSTLFWIIRESMASGLQHRVAANSTDIFKKINRWTHAQIPSQFQRSCSASTRVPAGLKIILNLASFPLYALHWSCIASPFKNTYGWAVFLRTILNCCNSQGKQTNKLDRVQHCMPVCKEILTHFRSHGHHDTAVWTPTWGDCYHIKTLWSHGFSIDTDTHTP